MIFPILTFLILACNTSPSKDSLEKKRSVQQKQNLLTNKEKEYYATAIQPIYENLLVRSGFSGGILIAKDGEIVFEDYRGLIDKSKNEALTATSPIHLASISKTFTAMAILRLMEQNRLNLSDNITLFLPTFPYQNITIKDLLTHRSGLPNYVYFMENTANYQTTKRKNKKGRIVYYKKLISTTKGFKGIATNLDVLQWMIDKKPSIEAVPNRVFKYCNTNYVLLALIAERASGVPFPNYMKDTVFGPLGMKNTYVFNTATVNNYIPSYQYNNAPYNLEKFDCVFGDKNVYSTPRDMLLWDKAMYEGSFVSKATLELAFTGYSNEHKGVHNYGLGWRLLINPTDTVVYHNGWWHGNNTVFTRLVKQNATIIVLGNKYNRNIYSSKKFGAVFTGVADTTRMIE